MIYNIRIVRRDGPDDAPRLADYQVSFDSKETVLHALQTIYESDAPDLAFRYYCRGGKCGQCTVVVNGEPCVACVERAKQEMIVEPIASMPVIKDLVVDREAMLSRTKALQPGSGRARQPEKGPEPVALQTLDEFVKLSKCIECFACMSACPKVDGPDGEFVGPLGMLWLAQRVLDPRDQTDCVALAMEQGLQVCDLCGKCRKVCPRVINVPKAIGRLQKMAKIRGKTGGR